MEHTDTGPSPRLLHCQATDAFALRAYVYDMAAKRAFRIDFEMRAGRWCPGGKPRPILDGGPTSDADALAHASVGAVEGWHARNHAILAETGRARSKADLARTERRAARLSASARAAHRASKRHAQRAEAWDAALIRAIREHSGDARVVVEMPRADGKVRVEVRDADPLVRMEGGIVAEVLRDGAIHSRVSESEAVRSVVLQAARRRPDPLQPLGRLLSARWDERSERVRAEAVEAEIAGLRAALAETEARRGLNAPTAVGDDPAHEVRFPWSRCAFLDARTMRVILHDLDRSAQVTAVADLEGADWVIDPVKLVTPFARPTRRAERMDDIDGYIAELVVAHALANVREAEFAEERRLRREAMAAVVPSAPRDPWEAGDAILEDGAFTGDAGYGATDPMEARFMELEDIAAGLRTRLSAIVSVLERSERAGDSMPMPSEITVENVRYALAVTEPPCRIEATVVKPLSIGGPDAPERLVPGFVFDLDGRLVESNPDWHRLRDTSDGWTVWADIQARKAATVVREAIDGPVRLELESRDLRREIEGAESEMTVLQARLSRTARAA